MERRVIKVVHLADLSVFIPMHLVGFDSDGVDKRHVHFFLDPKMCHFVGRGYSHY